MTYNVFGGMLSLTQSIWYVACVLHICSQTSNIGSKCTKSYRLIIAAVFCIIPDIDLALKQELF